jgi:hypothetical protein
MHYPKPDIDRLYMKRKEGRRGLSRTEAAYKEGIINIAECTCLIQTSEMHFSFLIYRIIDPLHVSNRLSIHDNEAITICAAYGI